MSYMSVLPNCYFATSGQSPALPAHYLPSQNHFNNPPVLPCLAFALRTSLHNYRLSYQSNASNLPPAAQLPSVDPTTHKLHPNALELTLSPQEYKENNEMEIKQIAQHNQSCSKEGVGKQESQSPTDDELHQEKERAQKKPQLSRRQAKREKEVAVNQFVVPVPEIDLLETAYMPRFPMQAEELARKREEMLMRRVETWGDAGRSRKDKREVRMLSG